MIELINFVSFSRVMGEISEFDLLLFKDKKSNENVIISLNIITVGNIYRTVIL
jgi:hypothetical protein